MNRIKKINENYFKINEVNVRLNTLEDVLYNYEFNSYKKLLKDEEKEKIFIRGTKRQINIMEFENFKMNFNNKFISFLKETDIKKVFPTNKYIEDICINDIQIDGINIESKYLNLVF